MIFEDKGTFSEELLLELKKDEIYPQGDHNRCRYQFKTDGTFRLLSINDYGQNDERGTFKLSEDEAIIEREITKPNSYKKK